MGKEKHTSSLSIQSLIFWEKKETSIYYLPLFYKDTESSQTKLQILTEDAQTSDQNFPISDSGQERVERRQNWMILNANWQDLMKKSKSCLNLMVGSELLWTKSNGSFLQNRCKISMFQNSRNTKRMSRVLERVLSEERRSEKELMKSTRSYFKNFRSWKMKLKRIFDQR